MNKEDYFALRNLIEALSPTIHYYNECKIHVFNLHNFIQHLKTFKQSAIKLTEKKLPENPEVVKLYKRFMDVLVDSFFVYTPLLRSTLVLVFLIGTLRLLIKISGVHFHSLLSNSLEFFAWLKQESRQFGIIEPSFSSTSRYI